MEQLKYRSFILDPTQLTTGEYQISVKRLDGSIVVKSDSFYRIDDAINNAKDKLDDFLDD